MGFLREVHAWAGAALSLWLALVGVTGTASAFRSDIIAWTTPEARAPLHYSAAAYGQALANLDRELPGQVGSVTLAPGGIGAHRVYLRTGGIALADQQGRVIGRWPGGRIEDNILRLHNNLIPGKFGPAILTAASVASLLLILVGFVIWLPSARSFGLQVLPRSTRRPDVVRAHRNLAILIALPLFVQILFAAGLLQEGLTTKLFTRLLPGPAAEAVAPPPASSAPVDWPRVMANAQAAFPEARISRAFWPRGEASPVNVALQQPGELNTEGHTTVRTDRTGTVLEAEDSARLGLGERIVNSLYPIHAGVLAPPVTKYVWALLGLALTAISLYGLYGFVRRLVAPRRRARQA